MNSKIAKVIVSQEAKLKYKKQCLKNKNILFENDNIQLGCKLLPFYDFYSSRYYLQMLIFIGNKSTRKLAHFALSYRGTPNLQLHIEEKPHILNESSQFKERLLIQCKDYTKEILLLLNFQSQILTLQSIPIPISLFSFLMMVPQNMTTLPLTSSYNQLLDMLSSRFQYIEEIDFTVNLQLFKKGLTKDMTKYFGALTEHTQNLYASQFNLGTLSEEYVIVFFIKADTEVKVTLASNSYKGFEDILGNVKFLIGSD